MKILIFILFPFTLYAQEKFRVEYERRNFTKVDGNTEYHRAMEEQFSKPIYFELLGNKEECSLKEIDRIDNSQGQRYKMQVIGGYKDLEKYLNFTDNKQIISREMESKLYLINSNIKSLDWIITRETKKIQGYDVKKATYENDTFSYEAWFSIDIKSKCGPSDAFGLPGLVLEFTKTVINKPTSYTTFKLDKISLDNSIKIAAPTKGKNISVEEFDHLEEQYNNKLQERIKDNSVNKD